MTFDLTQLGPGFADFWRERHLCLLATHRLDESPHVVPVGATLDIATATLRVITSRDSVKAQLARRAGVAGVPVTISQVDRRRWSSLQGRAHVNDDVDAIMDAERRYAHRYQAPRRNPRRIVVETIITGVMGSV